MKTTLTTGRAGTRSFQLAAVIALASLQPAWAAPPATSASQRFVQEGIAVELAVEPLAAAAGSTALVEGEPARVRLSITDANTGAPLTSLYPGAWMDRMTPAAEGGEPPAECKQKIEAFIGGSILSRPESDLNVYYVLALNQDSTISIVDPLFGFGSSKLLAMVFLPSPGEDWALADAEGRLFVSLPESDRVAVVDTASWKIVAEVPTGPRPRRVALQPDGQYLWVAYEGKDASAPSGVTVVDARALKMVKDLPTGRGAHDLAVTGDSRFAFVTNEADGTVSVIDVAALAELRDVPTGARPTSIAWSSAAGAAYVVNTGDGTIAAVRPQGSQGEEPAARIQAQPGLGRIRFAPGGRLAFVVHPGKNEVHILDAARNKIVQTGDVEAEPDDVTFSDELAYVRHKGSETVLMIPLDVVGEEGRPVPVVDFPGGQNPPGKTPMPSLAAGIVQAPGAAAVLVANPLDKAIYYYKEGMAAPMGHFQNYSRHPRAVLVVDRSLRERAPGVYETTTQLTRAGRYELALFLDAPRLVHCFPLEVAAKPESAARAQRGLEVEVTTGARTVRAGEEVVVDLRLTDAASSAPKPGLKDVQVLTFLSPGIWQRRQWASDLGEGRYRISFTPPEPGIYYVFVEVASEGLAYQRSPFLVLRAEAAPAATPDAGQQGGRL